MLTFPIGHFSSGGGSIPITAEAVRYGANGRTELTTALSGIAASSTGMASLWFRLNDIETIFSVPFIYLIGRITIQKTNTSNKLKVVLMNDSYSSRLAFDSTSALTADATWHHVIVSWDTNASAGNKTLQVYLDGSPMAGTIDDDDPAFQVNATSGHANRESSISGIYGVDLAETYVNIAERLDLSDSANIEKFRSSSGETMDLGSDGSLPTGNSPIVYLNGNAANRNINPGYGGDFTGVYGTVTDTTPPS